MTKATRHFDSHLCPWCLSQKKAHSHSNPSAIPSFTVEFTSLLWKVDVGCSASTTQQESHFPQTLSSPDQCVCSLLQTGRLEGGTEHVPLPVSSKFMEKGIKMMSKLDYYHLMQMSESVYIYIYRLNMYIM